MLTLFLRDEQIKVIIFNLFKPLIQLTIQELMKPLEVNFNNQFDQPSATIKVLQSELIIKNQIVTDLEVSNKELNCREYNNTKI